jgi:pSer/pThr/pTyr-binding forkhead associated (FHA) protein
VGRSPDNEIVLPDPMASRHHAVINFDGAQFQIVDLGAANGTQVNGRRVAGPTPLKSGDVINIGDHALTFRGD